MWKAKGLHGTHSPFVYEFVEKVLQDKSEIARDYLVKIPGIPLGYENLISRIAAYNEYNSIVFISADTGALPVVHADLLIIDDKPKEWIPALDKYVSSLKKEGAVVLTGIHKTKEHTKSWQQVCMNPRVRMSIDMYGVGMLLFRKEFKERQHFVLKYS